MCGAATVCAWAGHRCSWPRRVAASHSPALRSPRSADCARCAPACGAVAPWRAFAARAPAHAAAGVAGTNGARCDGRYGCCSGVVAPAADVGRQPMRWHDDDDASCSRRVCALVWACRAAVGGMAAHGVGPDGSLGVPVNYVKIERMRWMNETSSISCANAWHWCCGCSEQWHDLHLLLLRLARWLLVLYYWSFSVGLYATAGGAAEAVGCGVYVASAAAAAVTALTEAKWRRLH